MFERITERGRQVVVLAQVEAPVLRHSYVGTEHLLLGLLREDGLAARVLESFGFTIERVRAQVVGIVGPVEEVAPGRIPLTPAAKNVLELAIREALTLGFDSVCPEHILLALVRENVGDAAPLLLDFDTQKINTEVMRMLAGPVAGTSIHRQSLGSAGAAAFPTNLDPRKG